MHTNDVTGSVADALWTLRHRIKRESSDNTIRSFAAEAGIEPHMLRKVIAPGSIKAVETAEKQLNKNKDSVK